MQEIINNKINEIFSNNSKIKKDINLKGFYMYEWISFEEFRSTFSRDYLYILSKFIILFGIIFVGVGIYDYYINQQFYLFFKVIVGLYLLLFFILINRMIYRSWIFIHISHIFFTDNHISILGKIIKYSDFYKIENELKYYEELFDEELMKSSKINEKISEFKVKVFSWSATKQEQKAKKDSQKSGNGCDIGGCDGGCNCGDCGDIGEGAIVLVVVTFILIGLYWISIRLFYAIGWIFSFFISYLFVGIMKLIIYIQNREEFIINSLFQKIENISREIIFSKNILNYDISEAINGNWNKGVNGLVLNFNNTVGRTYIAISLINKFKIILLKSKFKDIFNFQTYNLWTKNQILEPINEIIKLLNKTFEKLQKSIVDLEKQIKITDKSLVGAMENQLVRFKKQRDNILITQNQWKGIGAKMLLQDF